MPLESASWIDDLVETNPVSNDPVSQGDDHLRMLKRVLRDTFPGANHAFHLPHAEFIDVSVALGADDNFSLSRVDTTAGNITVSLPAASSVPDGYLFVLRKITGANSLVINPTGSDALNNTTSSITLTSDESWAIVWRSNASSWNLIRSKDIEDNSITPAMLTDIAESTIVGRAAGAGTGDPTQLTGAQTNVILPVFSTAKGLAPAATATQASNELVLGAAGTWLGKGAPDALLVDRQAGATAGGTFTSGAYQTRVLQTVKRNVNSCAALASNEFTLLAGTYYVEWEAPAYGVDGHNTRLYNVTDAVSIESGSPGFSANGNPTQSWSFGQEIITLAGTKSLRIEHQCATTQATTGFGRASAFGTETYTKVKIWRV
jgi:hypothetical protein